MASRKDALDHASVLSSGDAKDIAAFSSKMQARFQQVRRSRGQAKSARVLAEMGMQESTQPLPKATVQDVRAAGQQGTKRSNKLLKAARGRSAESVTARLLQNTTPALRRQLQAHATNKAGNTSPRVAATGPKGQRSNAAPPSLVVEGKRPAVGAVRVRLPPTPASHVTGAEATLVPETPVSAQIEVQVSTPSTETKGLDIVAAKVPDAYPQGSSGSGREADVRLDFDRKHDHGEDGCDEEPTARARHPKVHELRSRTKGCRSEGG